MAGWTGGNINSDGTVDSNSSNGIVVNVNQHTNQKIWTCTIDSGNLDNIFSLCISEDLNSLYVCGITTGDLITAYKNVPDVVVEGSVGGETDIFAAKIDANTGKLLWIYQYGSNYVDAAIDIAYVAETINTTESFYITGWTYGSSLDSKGQQNIGSRCFVSYFQIINNSTTPSIPMLMTYSIYIEFPHVSVDFDQRTSNILVFGGNENEYYIYISGTIELTNSDEFVKRVGFVARFNINNIENPETIYYIVPSFTSGQISTTVTNITSFPTDYTSAYYTNYNVSGLQLNTNGLIITCGWYTDNNGSVSNSNSDVCVIDPNTNTLFRYSLTIQAQLHSISLFKNQQQLLLKDAGEELYFYCVGNGLQTSNIIPKLALFVFKDNTVALQDEIRNFSTINGNLNGVHITNDEYGNLYICGFGNGTLDINYTPPPNVAISSYVFRLFNNNVYFTANPINHVKIDSEENDNTITYYLTFPISGSIIFYQNTQITGHLFGGGGAGSDGNGDDINAKYGIGGGGGGGGNYSTFIKNIDINTTGNVIVGLGGQISQGGALPGNGEQTGIQFKPSESLNLSTKSQFRL